MDSSLKRRDSMQQQQASPKPDSDEENNTNLGDRLISPCKRLRLRDSPVRAVTFTDQTNILSAQGEDPAEGPQQVAPVNSPEKFEPESSSPEKSKNPRSSYSEQDVTETDIVNDNTTDSSQLQSDECVGQVSSQSDQCRYDEPQTSPLHTTPVKELVYEEGEVFDSSFPETPLHPMPNNTPARSVILGDDDDSGSEAEDIIIINKVTLEDEQDVNPNPGTSITFADCTNLAGLRHGESTVDNLGESERSVTFADHTNVHGAQKILEAPPHQPSDRVDGTRAKVRTLRPRVFSNPEPGPPSESCQSVQRSDIVDRPPDRQRQRFSSTGNWLSSEEFSHHQLSLQSYGSLAPLGGPQRPAHETALPRGPHVPQEKLPRYVPPQSEYDTRYGSQRTSFHPQNLNHRFNEAEDLEQRRLVNYGSIDGPRGGLSHPRDLNHGGFPVYDRPPQPRDFAQNRHGLYGNNRGLQQGQLWFYGSIDDPKRMAASLQSVYEGDQPGYIVPENQSQFRNTSQSQGNLSRQRSESVFVRSASRRTLPRLCSRGNADSDNEYQLRSHEAPEPRRCFMGQSSRYHMDRLQEEESLGNSAHISQDGKTSTSRGSLCMLSNSGGSVAPNHVQESDFVQPSTAQHGLFKHAASARTCSSSGSHAELQSQGSSGRGEGIRYGYHSADHQNFSGSQGSINSHGRSMGSQHSLGSQERSAGGSHRSSGSQERSAGGSHRSSGSQERSAGGSHRSSGSQERSAGGSHRSSESQEKSAGRSHNSAESHGVIGLRHEQAFLANPLLARASKKRRVLETPGQIKVSAYLNCGLVTVHVIEGRNFSCNWKPVCDSYIKLSLIPEDNGRKLRLKSKPVPNTNNPVFDEKFSLELQKSDENKRLLISIWHKDLQSGCSEFMGCTSYGVRSILNNKEVNDWYYLLTEQVGKKKHLQVSTSRAKVPLKPSTHGIPQINKDVNGLETVTVRLERGKNGFGFTVVDEFPVRVGRVDLASPAEEAGLKPGDFIIKVNDKNVSRSTMSSVARLVKKCGQLLMLQVNRCEPPPQPKEPTEPKAPSEQSLECVWKRPEHVYESIAGGEQVLERTDMTEDGDNKENEMSMDSRFEVSSVCEAFSRDKLSASTPLVSLDVRHVQGMPGKVTSGDQKKLEAIHRLMSLEVDFIDFMQLGIQRYSRPLKHCIFNVVQHSAVFQNIEQLVDISEYHVRQMQENAPPAYPESDDDSQSSEDRHFASAVAMIYYSKVNMFCQAHETYAEGLSEANNVLVEMRQNEEFLRFIKDPPLEPGQPSISAFIFRPLQHIKELSTVFQEIYGNTPSTSFDHATLKHITQVLQESVRNISNMSNARVQSLTSLSSHTRSSSKGSCAASSAASSKADSGSESGHGRKKQEVKTSASPQPVRVVDREVMKMQDRLVFSENVPVFQLCDEERHIIYQGDLFFLHSNHWSKVQMTLFSDMVVLCQPGRDGSLHVLCDPIFVRDICQIETSKQHTTELVLVMCPQSPYTRIPTMQSLVFKTPTPEDLSTWKNLLEHRVKTAQENSTQDSDYTVDLTGATMDLTAASGMTE